MWQKLKKPSIKYSLIGLLTTGFVSGIIFWGGFNTGMEATNTMTFCIGCHEMRDNVYKEYKETIHYSNRTGASLRGWLAQLTVVERKRNPDAEHSSELIDASYSDAVMYQILAHCLEGFKRRIGYLKRYESLTEANMPSDWLYPGRNNRKPVQGREKVKGPVDMTRSHSGCW